LPMNRSKYPDDWEEIAERIKDKAGWFCQVCGFPHSKSIPGRTLTVHHKDGDPMNCSDENLIAACQRCHLKMEAQLRKRKKKEMIEKEQLLMRFTDGVF